MSFNLLDIVKEQVGGSVLKQISGKLGESPEKTEKAIGGAVPALLSGLLNKASSTDGANDLLKNLSMQDDGLLDDIGGALSSGNKLADSGGNMLKSLLGESGLGKMADIIAKFSGLGRGSSSALLSMLAPLLMGNIKRKLLSGGGLNPANLTSLLMGQKDNISAAMPKGLDLGSFAVDNLDDFKKSLVQGANKAVSGASSTSQKAASTVKSSVSSVKPSNGNPFLKWILPLVIIVGLALLAMNLLNKKNNAVTDVVDTAKNAAQSATETAKDAVSTATETAAKAANNAVSTATDTVKNAAEGAVDAAGNAVNAAGDAVNTATNAVGNAAEGAVDAAGNAVNAAGNAVNNAAEGAVDAAGNAVNAVGNAAEAASNATGKALNTAANSVEAAANAAANAGTAAAAAIAASFDGITGLKDTVVGNINVGKELLGSTQSLSKTLESIRDVESAKSALPKLTQINGDLSALTEALPSISDAGKAGLSKAVSSVLPQIQKTIDTVSALPGVGNVVKSTTDELLATLGKFVN